MAKRNWTDEQLTEAVATSISIADVIRKLGLLPQGSNYSTVKKVIANLTLDTTHFLGQSYLKGTKRNLPYNVPTSKLLIENSPAGTTTIKERILKENLLPYTCSECGIDEWNGKTIVLHIDHINGINNDHRIENLRFLCPNCHSQTDTYCGRNAEHKRVPNTCVDCGIDILRGSKRCVACTNKLPRRTKIQWLPNEEIQVMIKAHGLEATSRQLGVSSAAVRKHLRRTV